MTDKLEALYKRTAKKMGQEPNFPYGLLGLVRSPEWAIYRDTRPGPQIGAFLQRMLQAVNQLKPEMEWHTWYAITVELEAQFKKDAENVEEDEYLMPIR